MLGRSVGCAGRPAAVAPAPLQRHAGEHRGLAGAGRRRARGLVLVGRAPQPAEHVDAALLELGRARVLVLVDHVLVERLGHQPLGLRLHPRRHERRQVQPGVAVEHQLVVHELVGGVRVHLESGSAWRGARDRLARPGVERAQQDNGRESSTSLRCSAMGFPFRWACPDVTERQRPPRPPIGVNLRCPARPGRVA